jgi:hypothetical protein
MHAAGGKETLLGVLHACCRKKVGSCMHAAGLHWGPGAP